jgi:NACalpha-BTF3-like transcription factor
MIDGKPTFNVKQLWRVATHLGLDFERYRGADRVFKLLEKSALVIVICNEQTSFHTQYSPTELGISQTVLNLERLKKIQEFESQAKTMHMAIRKELASLPPTVYEVNLGPKNTFVIGRSEDNDLSVDDRYLSSKHAKVTLDSGRWIFEDLNSRNGCWKMEANNLRRVLRAQLADNDLYQLGSTVIRFRLSTARPR